MAESAVTKVLKIPRGLPTVRHYPPPTVELPANAEVPMFGKDDKPENKLQQIWTANVRVFNLNDPEELRQYTEVWQLITDGKGTISESTTNFHDGKYTALLRWSEFSYKIPETKKV